MLAALNKHWRPLTDYEYWHDLDKEGLENAIVAAGMSEETIDWIKEDNKGKLKIKDY